MRATVLGTGLVALLGALMACSSNTLQPIEGPDTGTSPDGGSGSSGSSGSAGSSGASGSSGTTTTDGGVVTTTRKRGLAYGYNSDDDLAALSSGIGWWYNWSSKPDDTLAKSYSGLGVEFVPMVWGKTFDAASLDAQVPKDATYLLTFNEPNFGAQSNLTPEQAAALWPAIETFAKSRSMKIVSPALNYCGGNCNETDPFVWLQKFFAACTGCQVDYIAAHWYACDKSALSTIVTKYEAFGKPIWVTEIACLDDASKVDDADELAYMKDAVTLLEGDPMVFRYAWFTGRQTSTPSISVLAPASGTLTPLGQQYVSLPH